MSGQPDGRAGAEPDGSAPEDGAGQEAARPPEPRPVGPPAYPPGSRFDAVAADPGEKGAAPFPPDSGGRGGSDAVPPPHRILQVFIPPDDPIRKVGRGIPDEAFIAPDDPFVPSSRSPEGRATGLGDADPRTHADARRSPDEPALHEIPVLLDRLARRIRDDGRSALALGPGTGRFEGALRSFLKGYLDATGEAGGREEMRG